MWFSSSEEGHYFFAIFVKNNKSISSLFISRKLTNYLHWQSQLKGVSICAKSLLKFSKIQFELPICDWIFFYSKNGVHYFFQQKNIEPRKYNWACIGQKTAMSLKQYTTQIDFIGEGTNMQIASAFDRLLSPNDVVFFARAKNSLNSIGKLLKHGIQNDIVVYANDPICDVPSQEFDILIFTSPLNVQVFFDHRRYCGEKIIAIGMTTANALYQVGIEDILIPNQSSEEALLQLVTEKYTQF